VAGGEGVIVDPASAANAAVGDARDERRVLALLAVCIAALTLVEAALLAPGHVLAGQIVDGMLLLVLLNFGRGQRGPGSSAEARPAVQAMRALALVPLARLLAAGLPLAHFSQALGELMVALPVGYAAIRFARVVGVSLPGLFGAAPAQPSRARVLRPEVSVPLAGAVLGLFAYLAGAPALASSESSPGRILLAAAAVTVTVVVEELVFRGLLQTSLQRAAGRLGFIAATALFGCAYLASGSAAVVLTVGLAGVVFAHRFAQTGNLRSAILGHYELAIGAFVAWPVLFGRSDSWLEGPVATVLLGLAVVGAVAAAVRRPLPQVRP
jgi:membrane protease YdiL (CAAX protease family)